MELRRGAVEGQRPQRAAAGLLEKLLVRARLAGAPLPPESVLTTGWRSAHVLPDLLAVLDGQRVVRVADVKAEAPFAPSSTTPH